MRMPEPSVFALAFVGGMRDARWLKYPPTLRTALALTRMLVVRRLRTGRLSGDDFVDCAQLVTPIEDKQSAAEVALNVLSAPTRLPFSSYIPSAESQTLAGILAQMELAKTLEDAEPVDAAQKIEALLLDPDFAALIEELGGIESARARFNSEQAVKDRGCDLVRDRTGGLSSTMFSLALKLGMAPEIAENSSSQAERAAARVVLGQSDAAAQLDLLGSFDLKIKLLKLLAGARVNIAEPLQRLADQADRIEQLAAICALGFVQIDRAKAMDAIQKALPGQTFEELFEMTEHFAADLAGSARGVLFDGFADLDETQLAQHAHLGAQWKNALERAVTRRTEQAAQSTFQEGLGLMRNLHAVSRSLGDPVLSQHLSEGLAGVAEGVAGAARTVDELFDLIHVAEAMGTRLGPDLIREQGYRLGLSRREMDQILTSRLALIKRMIEQGERSFERFSRLIEQERPSREQIERLTQLAVKNDNSTAMAALGGYNLSWALSGAEANEEGQDRIVESLSAGPGTNLLVQWFSHREKIPERIKAPLRRLAKEVLVQYAVALGKELIGDRSRGVLEGETSRSFVCGDDPSLVDMEETVDNLVSQGKSLSMIQPEDLRVRETIHGRRAVALLVDISGSMHGEKLTWCSIAAAMLAYCLRPDELALAFFESDTHVVKSFSDRMPVEQVADDLLNLSSQGGTMLGSALEWLCDELRGLSQRRKNALILTDAGIFDLEDCAGPCRLLSALHTSTTWFVPQSQWAEPEAAALARWSRGTIVLLHSNWKRFPKLISEALG